MKTVWTGLASLLGAAACGQPTASAAETQEAEALSASCTLTAPVRVVSGLNHPFHVEVDDRFVYYLAFAAPAVHLFRVDKSGAGAPRDFGIVDITGVYDFDVDPARLYYMDFGNDSEVNPLDGRLRMFDKSGKAPVSIRARPGGDCRHEYLEEVAAGGDGTVYWLQRATTRDAREGCSGDGDKAIARLVPGATRPEIIANVSANAAGLRADASHVFWIEETGIRRLKNDGSIMDGLFLTSTPISEIAIDALAVTYAVAPDGNGDGGGTFRVDASGVSTPVLDQPLEGIRSDGAFIYGTLSRGPGVPANVMRVKPNGHGLTFLAKAAPGAVAVDDAYVYYVDPTETSVFKTCK